MQEKIHKSYWWQASKIDARLVISVRQKIKNSSSTSEHKSGPLKSHNIGGRGKTERIPETVKDEVSFRGVEKVSRLAASLLSDTREEIKCTLFKTVGYLFDN